MVRRDGSLIHCRDRPGNRFPSNTNSLEQEHREASHGRYIAGAMNRSDGMRDEEDGIYYDILRLPDGGATRKSVRACVFAIIVVSFPNRCRFPVRPHPLLDSV